MKKKDIEKKLHNSLSENTPNVWATIAQKTGVDTEKATVEIPVLVTEGAPAPTRKGKTRIFTTVMAIIGIFLCVGGLLLQFLTKKDNGFTLGGSFFIDINPSIQITLTDENTVNEIIPLNEDASVLLAKTAKTQCKGKTPTEVAVFVWQLAYETGYISPDRQNNALLISSALDDETHNERFNANITASLNQIIKQKGVYCAVLTERKEESSESAANVYHITAGKYQLIQRALELGAEIDEDEYQEITVRELNALIEELAEERQEWLEEELDRRYEEKYEQAKENHDKFIKDDDYEERYEAWLEEISEDYKQNWNGKKEEWKNSFELGNGHDDDNTPPPEPHGDEPRYW